MKTALLVGAFTPISLAPCTALLQFSRDAQHQSLGPCSRSLHQCCSGSKMKTALLVGAVTPTSLAPRTALLQFSRDAQHQSLGHCLRSLNQCCSVKQDENSLACRCSHTYKFGTLHSSAAIQQRCAAPKPGTLFTLTAPVLLCEAR